MSSSDASSSTCPDIGAEDNRNLSVADKSTRVNNDNNIPESADRERVLKAVGSTSTTFIGPALPPESVKTDIDNALNDFYKELEEVDATDGANGNQGKQEHGVVHAPTPSTLSTTEETKVVGRERIVNSRTSGETDGYQKSSWPHWYQNEPYSNRRSRPGYDVNSGRAAFAQNPWHHPHPRDRDPSPRFHRPPVHGPPPPSEFANPQNPPINRNVSNLYQENSHFSTFCSFPPSNVCTVPSQGFYRNPEPHFDRNDHSHLHDAQLEHEHFRWPRDREEDWSPFAVDYDKRLRFDSVNNHWEKPHQYRPTDNTLVYHPSLVLILMRGLPGSGKSTRARELISTGPSGLILSTDDYFFHEDGYHYEPGLLGAAHEWNQSRAKDAIRDGRSPIIIDNTNLQAWEMKPYVKMALERGYRVDFCEPDTSWKFDPYELEKRNKHGVPQEKITQMLDRFSFPVSVDIVMNSQEPPHVNHRHRPQQPGAMRKQDFH